MKYTPVWTNEGVGRLPQFKIRNQLLPVVWGHLCLSFWQSAGFPWGEQDPSYADESVENHDPEVL